MRASWLQKDSLGDEPPPAQRVWGPDLSCPAQHAHCTHAACGVVGVGVGKADGEGVPQEYWRHVTLSLMWANFLINLIQALSGVGRNSMK